MTVVISEEAGAIPVLRVHEFDVPLEFLGRMRPEPVAQGETLTIELAYNVAYAEGDGVRGNVVRVKVS